MAKYNKSVKGKLYKYFNQRLSLKPSTKGFIRGNCPHCGGKFTFGINIEASKVNCFKHCGVAESPLKLLMEFEQLETFNDAYDFLKIQQEYDEYDGGGRREKRPELKPVLLPESYTLLNMGAGIMADAARRYIKGRKFNITKCAMSGIGYCTEGDYAGYIIFPFFHNGQLEFFQGRRYAGAGPKMQNPREEDFGIGKSQLLYNRDALFIYRRIFLVESITNALTIGERAVATLGKTLSPWQLTQFIKAPFEELVIMLDMDAWDEAIHLAMQLVHYKKVKLVFWPITKRNEDVNDLGKKKVLDYAKGFEFSTYSEFYKLKQNPPKIICQNRELLLSI